MLKRKKKKENAAPKEKVIANKIKSDIDIKTKNYKKVIKK